MRGYVHELYRYLAACDVAVVQGGLTTGMELVAAGRPFVSIPLAQPLRAATSTSATGSTATAPPSWLDYADTTPQRWPTRSRGSQAPLPPTGRSHPAGPRGQPP